MNKSKPGRKKSDETEQFRICTKCHEPKLPLQYYVCLGQYRGECKKCTIRLNGQRQRDNKYWQKRFGSIEERRAHMRQYYADNPEKFAKYREEFRKRNPDYYRLYVQKKRNPQQQHKD